MSESCFILLSTLEIRRRSQLPGLHKAILLIDILRHVQLEVGSSGKAKSSTAGGPASSSHGAYSYLRSAPSVIRRGR
jgi:hypothetical protein